MRANKAERMRRIRALVLRLRAQKDRRLLQVRTICRREERWHGEWLGLHNPPGPGYGQGAYDRDDAASILARVRAADTE